MTAPLADRLDAGLGTMGISASAVERDALLALVHELLRWNARINLTAIRDAGEVITQHLLDSLSILHLLQGGRVLDVGSGGGFPGLPLAVMASQRQFTLVEANARKAAWLQHAASHLQLRNVTVRCARIEGMEFREPPQDIVARAFSSLADLASAVTHASGAATRILAMKGRMPKEEIAAVPPPWRVETVIRLNVPGLDAERHAVILLHSAGTTGSTLPS
ncbi:MAG: 16S rRNA (guanine(527)-N(7))-methyltransferase RsmG [Steroidobacteraceae bacterium]